MKLPVPHDLTPVEAQVAIVLLERIIDALIELHSGMRRVYYPWGETADDNWPY